MSNGRRMNATTPGLVNLRDRSRDMVRRHRPAKGAANICPVCFTTWRCRAYRNAALILLQFGEDPDERAGDDDSAA
ncbi:MAG: hypothetical protein V7603_4016 [Micromonosporaceae bacterium]